MLEVIERIKEISEKYHSVRAFSREIDVNESTVRQYLSGREPKLSFCVQMTDKLGISLLWLLKGQGEIFLTGNPPMDKINEPLEIQENLQTLQDYKELVRLLIKENDKLKERVNYNYVKESQSEFGSKAAEPAPEGGWNKDNPKK